MVSLAFVTPVHRRFELTRLCMEQRRRACDALARSGLDATAIYVGDDENLEVARELGFLTFERPNGDPQLLLGRKFNDGFELAAKEGIDYVVACGSDQFTSPVMMAGVSREDVPDDVWYVHRNVAIVPVTGDRYLRIWIDSHTPRYGGSAASAGAFRTMPVKTLAHCGYRPCKERIPRGCDYSTWKGGYRGYEIEEAGGDPLEVVNFQSRDVQVTRWDALVDRWQDGGNLVRDPWLADLLRLYDEDLVGGVVEYYMSGADGGAQAA